MKPGCGSGTPSPFPCGGDCCCFYGAGTRLAESRTPAHCSAAKSTSPTCLTRRLGGPGPLLGADTGLVACHCHLFAWSSGSARRSTSGWAPGSLGASRQHRVPRPGWVPAVIGVGSMPCGLGATAIVVFATATNINGRFANPVSRDQILLVAFIWAVIAVVNVAFARRRSALAATPLARPVSRFCKLVCPC